MSRDLKKLKAARSLARGSTQAAAAREAGVDRATIGRWLKDQEFKEMVVTATDAEDSVEDPTVEAERGLSRLVPQAERVLEEALAGADVSTQMARVALDIIKAARALEPKAGSGEDGTPTLASLISELDADERNHKM